MDRRAQAAIIRRHYGLRRAVTDAEVEADRETREGKVRANPNDFPCDREGPRYRVTQFGRRLDGKQGVTGVIEGLSADDVKEQLTHAAKRGEYIRVDRMNPPRQRRELSVPEQHQLRIARQTLRMADPMARIMGGPTKKEARDIIQRLTGQEPEENPRKPLKLSGKMHRLPSSYDVDVYVWEERDRLHIEARDRTTDRTIAEWWDEDARQMFEDGFFERGRRLEHSVVKYLQDHGLVSPGP